MAWKTVSAKRYLYKKTGNTWVSLGPETDDTLEIHRQFHDGRERAKARLASLSQRLDELAAINRAMRIGRVPTLTARILRALDRANLLGTVLDTVGTNALYVYERMAGVRIDNGLLATADIDLLFDSRRSLNLAARDDGPTNLLAILRKVDKTFEPTGKASFRAANAEGFLIDLIMPTPSDRMMPAARSKIGDGQDDLVAIEIEGLAWLVSSPKISAVLIDERGYPLACTVPDPRSFAIHKLWLSGRADRDPAKRTRDRLQAQLVGGLVASRLIHLKLDDPVLAAIPAALRLAAHDLFQHSQTYTSEPNW